ncbi:2-oxoglutarate and iron-dependent oxygenase domain-containing protein [Roseibacterium sp. SDUM158017]|uniref:isopenicillin N synthase family dioxygenase n=1 Tax=Roseicyclus salinarum TaxID=3036773 RepID=UPI00241516D7|nr:2OG-Fe(II) oxygenase family protein [Roseibacterium sp. SDUM158017]MDG4648457.1 2-oxoglutarate and iron-dependent oxygenase domain-containing protein [Roseibacterium sp. SDUM158017]
MRHPDHPDAHHELSRERRMGGIGAAGAHEVALIDLSDYEDRKPRIADALWQAATTLGLFQLTGHGIPIASIEEAFALSEAFFALPEHRKAALPLRPGTNAGWEFKSQVRPSTGTPDQKESYQITRPRMEGLWPDPADIPGFRETMLAFERANWEVAMKVLSCFALKLGFDEDLFARAHDPASPDYQSTLRLIHYLPMQDARPEDFEGWRAGAHTDFDCLTLLHQKTGQGGLQVCPGHAAEDGAWTDVEPRTGIITCNIGDMLMRWSDDRLLSNPHRVRMPRADEYLGPRYSIPFFAQANRDFVLQGPDKAYPAIKAGDYIQERIRANYDALKARP